MPFILYLCCIIAIIYYLVRKFFKYLDDLKKDFNGTISELTKKISDLNKEIIDIKNKNRELENDFRFHQNFFIEYEDIKKQELVENENKNKARAQYLLLLFYSKIKISIVFLRIVMFRKIVNCLLTDIIDKNKNKLKKTYKKYIDVLKPKDIRSKFFIIYCCTNMINNVGAKMVNIIIDFLMYIHDYTSSRIHLTNIENYQDIIENIINGNEKETKETKENKNKTERSVKTNELIDYIFNSYDLEKETQAIFKKIEYEDNLDKNQGDINEINNKIKEEQKKKKKKKKEDEKQEKKIIKRNRKNKKKINVEEFNEINIINNKEENKNKNKKEIKKENIINNKKENNKENQINKIIIGYEDKKDYIEENKDNKNKIYNIENKEAIGAEQKLKNEEEKNEMFEKFKNKYLFSLNNNKNEEEKKYNENLIKKIFLSHNGNLSIAKLIKLYNDNIKGVNDLKNISQKYKEKIDKYEITIWKEYSIEKILENYKKNFNKNSEIYNGIDTAEHYSFQKNYQIIIDRSIVQNLNMKKLKESVKKLSGNGLIDIIGEDVGKFGDSLDVVDI